MWPNVLLVKFIGACRFDITHCHVETRRITILDFMVKCWHIVHLFILIAFIQFADPALLISYERLIVLQFDQNVVSCQLLGPLTRAVWLMPRTVYIVNHFVFEVFSRALVDQGGDPTL